MREMGGPPVGPVQAELGLQHKQGVGAWEGEHIHQVAGRDHLRVSEWAEFGRVETDDTRLGKSGVARAARAYGTDTKKAFMTRKSRPATFDEVEAYTEIYFKDGSLTGHDAHPMRVRPHGRRAAPPDAGRPAETLRGQGRRHLHDAPGAGSKAGGVVQGGGRETMREWEGRERGFGPVLDNPDAGRFKPGWLARGRVEDPVGPTREMRLRAAENSAAAANHRGTIRESQEKRNLFDPVTGQERAAGGRLLNQSLVREGELNRAHGHAPVPPAPGPSKLTGKFVFGPEDRPFNPVSGADTYKEPARRVEQKEVRKSTIRNNGLLRPGEGSYSVIFGHTCN